MRGRLRLAVALSVALTAVGITLWPSPGSTQRARASAPQGMDKLQHLIFIVQENRSFDHYFGTFPGADGFPTNAQGKISTCVPDPYLGRCVRPYHTTTGFQLGGRHNDVHSKIDVNGGEMDGFVRSLSDSNTTCWKDPRQPACAGLVGPQLQPDVMSYMNATNIPNYWRWAKHYSLGDRLFAASDSWTLPSHLYLLSGWSATCSDRHDPMSCRSDGELHGPAKQFRYGEAPVYPWTDITYLLDAQHVDWGFYVDNHTCTGPPCAFPTTNETDAAKNPLPGFTDVVEDGSLDKIQPQRDYLSAAAAGSLPPVSWIVPGRLDGEHPHHGSVKTGMAFVTRMVDAAMNGPDWNSTAIFVTWDDWGGFYDHVPPPTVDAGGYGIRVPLLIISPYAPKGGIFHQTLSFDAFLKLIEDRFLGGQRLDPASDGRPDSRPNVRENQAGLGDLSQAFDFTQPPRAPYPLDPTPFG